MNSDSPEMRGKLLVATPSLSDPNFVRSVVFILEQNDEGALGLILNRPSDVAVDDPLAGWSDFAARPKRVFFGGPVEREAVICLARVGSAIDSNAFTAVLGNLGTLDVSRIPAETDADVESIRVFAGYAGWGSGQLAEEIAAGGWFIVDSQPGDLFADNPDRLWRDVLRRQPGELAFVATFPENPALN